MEWFSFLVELGNKTHPFGWLKMSEVEYHESSYLFKFYIAFLAHNWFEIIGLVAFPIFF